MAGDRLECEARIESALERFFQAPSLAAGGISVVIEAPPGSFVVKVNPSAGKSSRCFMIKLYIALFCPFSGEISLFSGMAITAAYSSAKSPCIAGLSAKSFKIASWTAYELKLR